MNSSHNASDRDHGHRAEFTVAEEACGTLLDEHEVLLEEIDRLHRWWLEAAEIGKPKFGEMGYRVKLIRGRMAQHFAHEEEGGYLAKALQVAPQYKRPAAALLHQHGEFLHELDNLVERLEGQSPSFHYWSEAQRALDAILLRLKEHEELENKIMQSASSMNRGD